MPSLVNQKPLSKVAEKKISKGEFDVDKEKKQRRPERSLY
jgi:hypothetical protein